jgi:HEAT repeat protein
VKAAVTDADQSIHSTAIRVLGEWKTAEAIPVLLDLAKSLSNANEKLLSLRGYLGMAIRRDIPVGDRLAICQQASAMIQRDEEKRMMLGALGSIAKAESLALIIPCIDNQGTRGEAISTVLAIAEKRERGQQVALTREALQKVVAVAPGTDGAKRAQGFLKKMEGEK